MIVTKKARSKFRKRRKSTPKTHYCKQLLCSAPVDLRSINSIEKKCEIFIDVLKNSLIYFDDVFGSLGFLGEQTSSWSNGIYSTLIDIETLIENYSEDNDIGRLLENLEVEASFLEEILDSGNGLLCGQKAIRYSDMNDETDKLLESLEMRIEKEVEIVRKVGYDLYHVMIGAV